MTIRPIITIPDPVLREVSQPIEQVDSDVSRLINDMLETMYDAPGVGLAAIQIAVPKRLVVIDIADEDEAAEPLCMINPEIVALDETMRTYEEGCLSIPDIRVEIDRPASCTVRYIDRKGAPQELKAEGLLATAIQHEVDHLDGKLIIDFLSRLRRDMIIRRFKKMSRTGG